LTNNTLGSLILGNGNGTFKAAVDFYTGGFSGFAGLMTGDFNNDGLLDFAAGDPGFGVGVWLGTTSPVAYLSKTKVVFPTQVVGTTSAKVKVTLSNIGSAPLDSISVTSAGDFAQTNNCPISLSPGSNCTINITFKPSDIGSRTGNIMVCDNNDNVNGSCQQISLLGTGTVVSLSPSKVTFPAQKVGTTSGPQSVTVTNTSLSAIGINKIAIAGADKGDFAQTNTCGDVLQARNSCTISITFTPTATGTRTAKVNVNDTGGGSPQPIGLAGTGQ
jgi:Abnormal spindle-like microcephaly-assoc'd, ASPM-SPD-2-Hydin